MATTSTVPSAKAALTTLVAAALATAGDGGTAVQVSYGRPPDSRLDRECVWIGDVTGDQRVPTMKAGRKSRHETYSISVLAWVAVDRGTAQESEARAYVLLGAVEDAVANDPTLGIAAGTAYFGAQAGAFETAADNEDGVAAVIRMDIDCEARLS